MAILLAWAVWWVRNNILAVYALSCLSSVIGEIEPLATCVDKLCVPLGNRPGVSLAYVSVIAFFLSY